METTVRYLYCLFLFIYGSNELQINFKNVVKIFSKDDFYSTFLLVFQFYTEKNTTNESKKFFVKRE